jgi:hypothetical protein
MTIEELRNDFNVRSSHGYYIAESMAMCGHCSSATRVFAVALPCEHETVALDPDADRDESAQDTWEAGGFGALLFYVERLSAAVQQRLAHLAPGMRFSYSAQLQGAYWANHCECCDSLLEDHELFCEPEGAFLPVHRPDEIRLSRIDERFEALAAGYVCAPPVLAVCAQA